MNTRNYNDQWSYGTEGNVAFVPTFSAVSENSNVTYVTGFGIYDRGKDFGEKRFWGKSSQNNEKIVTYDENERNLLDQARKNFFNKFNSHSEFENDVPDIDDMIKSLEILREISKWDEDWSGNKIDPVPKKVMDTACNIVRNLFHQPNIFPTGRESVQMEYHRSDRSYLEFEIFETEIVCTEIPQRQYDKANFQKLDLNDNHLIPKIKRIVGEFHAVQ